MAFLSRTCLYPLVISVIFLFVSAESAEAEGRRSRGRINDSRYMYKKSGECPDIEVLNRLTNTVCDNAECHQDADCPGDHKCCLNNCGGRSCSAPLERETIPTDAPVISEVEDPYGLLTVNEGETVVLYCNASARIPTSYGWILIQPGASVPNIDVFPPGSTTGNKRVSSDGRILTVAGARVEDTANYACVAASLLGYVTRSYQLFVHGTGVADAPPPPPATNLGEDHPLDVASNWPELVSPYLNELSQRISTTPAPTAVPTPSTTSMPAGGMGGGVDGSYDVASSVCQQPRNKGTCNGQEQRWFFNTSKGKCEPFTYSGCNGNLNNFRTYDECNRTCPMISDNPCEQPIMTGPCRARIMRWAYDTNAGGCVKFVYGGCRKNGNNFASREECADQCMKPLMIYDNLQPPSARVAECRCVKPRLKNCFCSSEFAIEGTVIQKHNSLRGDILVVEVANVFKQGTLHLRKTERLSNNVTIIRDMSQIGRSCQCHSLEPNSVSYIIMGHVNTRGDAEIDSNSYVSEATRRRSNKLESQNMRPQYCRQASRQSPRERSAPRGRVGQ